MSHRLHSHKLCAIAYTLSCDHLSLSIIGASLLALGATIALAGPEFILRLRAWNVWYENAYIFRFFLGLSVILAGALIVLIENRRTQLSVPMRRMLAPPAVYHLVAMIASVYCMIPFVYLQWFVLYKSNVQAMAFPLTQHIRIDLVGATIPAAVSLVAAVYLLVTGQVQGRTFLFYLVVSTMFSLIQARPTDYDIRGCAVAVGLVNGFLGCLLGICEGDLRRLVRRKPIRKTSFTHQKYGKSALTAYSFSILSVLLMEVILLSLGHLSKCKTITIGASGLTDGTFLGGLNALLSSVLFTSILRHLIE